MHNHAPAHYTCPICLGVEGIESDGTLIHQSDILYKDTDVMVFVASYFVGQNDGHIIVVPTQHYENLYELSDEVGAKIFAISRKMAQALREAYNCQGVTVLQNNEPAGGQHAFHYHMHLFPRYENDNLHANMMSKRVASAQERAPFVEKMKRVLAKE